MPTSNRPIYVVGCGGHAKVVLDTLAAAGRPVAALVVQAAQLQQANELAARFAVARLMDDADLLEVGANRTALLVNGVGSIGDSGSRKRIFDQWRAVGYEFTNVIHPSAIISRLAWLGSGVQVFAGAVIQADAMLEDNVLINTGALVDHDCKIGAHTHIAPGAVLSGSVSLGACCHIGVGARIIQGLQIGAEVLVGAGAVVISDIPFHHKALGVPARAVSRN